MQAKTFYTRNTIARNIKHLGNGVLEIRRYQDGNLRMVALWLFFVCMFFVAFDFINKDGPFYDCYKDIYAYYHKEQTIMPQWEFFQDKKNPEFSAGGVPKEKFFNRISKNIDKRFSEGIMGFCFPLILLIIAGYPRFRPLRIDAKRRLVYWGAGFDFYIMRLPMMTETRYPPQSLNILQPRAFCPALRPSGQEALMLTIPHESDPEQAKNIDLGIFRPTAANQYLQIEAFLNDFLACDNPEEKYAEYFKRESIIASDFFNLFYQFSLFPHWGYNDKKVEEKIQAFLQREA
ncbi:MAG: hypothetical protein KGV56_02335 [Gammaproteobacteria bacterium]|nr:hypothetical protein [Gammaproteobacteria bacterium]